MPIVKNDYPILEYDTKKRAVIEPGRDGKGNLPKICVITFFQEVLEQFIEKCGAEAVFDYESEMRNFPIYACAYKGVHFCVTQATVGAGSIAMQTDYLFGNGVNTLLACGSCGVLTEIPEGAVILPVCALRDEGASYHYLPPSRTIALDEDIIGVLEKTLEVNGTPYIKCMTWSTDAFYRETPDMVEYRKQEGCRVVEMECSTIAAVARFREKKFGQLLYSGDILADAANYDDRDWYNNISAREKLFYLTVEAAVTLAE